LYCLVAARFPPRYHLDLEMEEGGGAFGYAWVWAGWLMAAGVGWELLSCGGVFF
jgi:hypothetical protein